MNRRTFVALSTLIVSGVVFGTAVLANGGWPFAPLGRGQELADPSGWISEPDFDGRTAVWIEVGPGRSQPRPVQLVIRRLAQTEAQEVRLPVPEIDEEDPLGWLTGGPRIWGDTIVFSTRFDRPLARPSFTLYAYDIASGQLEELVVGDFGHPIRDPAIHDDLVVWADGRSGDLDIWAMELTDRLARPLVGPQPGHQYAPLVSDGWVVWLSGDVAGTPGEVYALRRGTDRAELLNPGQLAYGLALYRSRVAWCGGVARSDSYVYVHDLDRGEGGLLSRSPCSWARGGQPGEPIVGTVRTGVAVSDDWIVRSTGGTQSAAMLSPRPGGPPGELLGYDARAITSLHNLESYLEPYTVAETMTDVVQPVLGDFTVLWAEPDPEGRIHGGDRHLMRLLLARYVIYLPLLEH